MQRADLPADKRNRTILDEQIILGETYPRSLVEFVLEQTSVYKSIF